MSPAVNNKRISLLRGLLIQSVQIERITVNKLKALMIGLGLIAGMAFVADTEKAKTGSVPLPEKVVVLSFDDAISSHYSVVAPILKDYGFGATFFICEFPPDFDNDKTKYLGWEQIAELNKMGFEIGNHTRTHEDIGKLSNEQLTDELNYIDEKCKSHGIPKTVTFAYPGYGLSTNALPVFQERSFLFARAGWDRCYDPAVDHPYLVPSFDISGTNDLKVINFLKQAAPGKIVVLTIHGVPDLAHDWVNTPPELFKKYMRFLKDNHYTVIAMRDLARYVDAKKEIGLRSSLPGSWFLYHNTHNDKYVFGVHNRFNAADDVKGWKEATDAVEQNRAANPHLDSR